MCVLLPFEVTFPLFSRVVEGNNGGNKSLEIPLVFTVLQCDYCLFSVNSACSANIQKAPLMYPAKCIVLILQGFFIVSVIVKQLKLNACDLSFPNLCINFCPFAALLQVSRSFQRTSKTAKF